MPLKKTLSGKTNRRYVAEGFKDDAFNILRQFYKSGRHTLPDFINLWNENHLSMIYMGRTSYRELCEFTNECFASVIALMRHKDSPIHGQIGAIYLLYCLYGSQPFEKYKIRVTFKDYSLICNLLERSRETKLVSLTYAIVKLKDISAFHFVGNTILMGPEIPRIRSIVLEEHVLSIMVGEQWNGYIRDICESEDMQKVKHVHEVYENMRRVMGVASETSRDDELSTDFMRILQNAACGDSKIFHILDTNNNVPPDEVDCKPQDIGARRAYLKQQQVNMYTNTKFSVSKQEPESMADTSSNSIDSYIDEPPSTKASKKKPHKRLKCEITDLSEEEELDELSIKPFYSSKKSRKITKQDFRDTDTSSSSIDSYINEPSSAKASRKRPCKRLKHKITDLSEEELDELDIKPFYSSKKSHKIRKHDSKNGIQSMKEVIPGDFNNSDRIPGKQRTLRPRLSSKSTAKEVVSTDQEEYESSECADDPDYEPEKGFEVKKKKVEWNCEYAKPNVKAMPKAKSKQGRLRNKRRQCQIRIEKPVSRRISRGGKWRHHYNTSDGEDSLEAGEDSILTSDDDTSHSDKQNH